MFAYRYVCWIVGEPYARASKFHESTRRRVAAFAIAVHIPIVIWALTAYLIADRIFELTTLACLASSAVCSALIYLVERLVLAMPKTWYVPITRLLIGAIVAFLGAVSVDLVLFDREVALQLQSEGEIRLNKEYEAKIRQRSAALAQAKVEWLQAEEAARCEANGTCGTRTKNVGPVYRELARQAGTLRRDYEAALKELDELETARTAALADWRTSGAATREAGLLARVEAFRAYVSHNPVAKLVWGLLFCLVLLLELTVVFVKLVFGETVDDVIERVREGVRAHQAERYRDAVTSPLAEARRVLAAPLV